MDYNTHLSPVRIWKIRDRKMPSTRNTIKKAHARFYFYEDTLKRKTSKAWL